MVPWLLQTFVFSLLLCIGKGGKSPIDIVYGGALGGHNDLTDITAPLDGCVQACQNNPKCNSIEYRFSDEGCWFSSTSQLPLYVNTDGWNYIDVNRVKNIQNFMKVQKASLSGTTALETVGDTTPETCATTCLLTETCKSFEISRESPHCCQLYKEDTSDKSMKVNEDSDFYQLRTSKSPIDIVYGGALGGHNDLTDITAPLDECVQACQNNPKCNSIEYRFSDEGCWFSSTSQLPLYVNTNGWNYIDVNRQKNIQKFLKVEKASILPTKPLRSIRNTRAETCATTCLSTLTCKSFEMTRKKHYCLLYKEDTSDKNMKVNEDRDLYQLKTSKSPIDIVYGGALNGYNDLTDITAPLDQCVQACDYNPKCNSIEYRFSDEGCWFSSTSQLPLYVNTNGWNYIEINREKSIQNFLKVEKASISPTTALEYIVNTTPENCAANCLSTLNCKSFEISRYKPYPCYLYKEDTTEKKMKVNGYREFYQLRTSKSPFHMVYGAALSGYDNLNHITAPLDECVQACQNNPKCNSIDYRFSDKGCYFSSMSQLPLYVNTNGWNYIEVNRVKKIQKFLKVERASLPPTTPLQTVVNTTPESCATTCLSTMTCKSFEISRKSPYTCHLYKEDTADKNMKVNENRDFYQLRRNVLQ